MFAKEQVADVARLIVAEFNRRHIAKQLMAQEGLLCNMSDHSLGDLLLKRARYKVYHGGRGGAKSWAAADALVILAATGHELILCTREYQNSIANSVHRVIRGSIEKMGIGFMFEVTDKSILCPSTGSEFIFKGLKTNTDEIKSTEGVTRVWVEEAHRVSDDSWDILIPTIRAPGSEIWVTFNPDNESDPSYQRFVVDPPKRQKCIIHQVNYDSNPYFPADLEEERLEAFEKIGRAANETERHRLQEKYNNIWLGRPKKQSEALVFKGKFITEAFDDDLWKQAERLYYGADFGFANDPSTLTRSFIVGKRLFIEYEAGGVGIDIDEMPQMYDLVPGSRNWPIKGDAARPETISYLKKKGFNITAAEKWQGSVEDGLAHMQGFDVIVIHTRCAEVINEFETYSYKQDKRTGEVLPVLVDANNHYIDGIRYGLDGYITKSSSIHTWVKLGKKNERKRS